MSEPIDLYDMNNKHISEMTEIADKALEEIEKDGRLGSAGRGMCFSSAEKQALKLYFLQYLANALDVKI